MALKVERVMDGGVDIQKALSRRGRLEPLHLALSSPHRLVRVLRPIVFSKPLLMAERHSELPESRSVERSLSVTTIFGAKPCFRSSLRMSRTAARLSRRL